MIDNIILVPYISYTIWQYRLVLIDHGMRYVCYSHTINLGFIYSSIYSLDSVHGCNIQDPFSSAHSMSLLSHSFFPMYHSNSQIYTQFPCYILFEMNIHIAHACYEPMTCLC